MKTLQKFSQHAPESIPASVAWSLSEISEARGRQQLFMNQQPQLLRRLREHALVESAVSSTRIEGVTVAHKRVGTVLFGKGLTRDRDEDELRGYRQALAAIHDGYAQMRVDEASIGALHAQVRPGSHDAGRYKERDGDIIEISPNGESRVRFRTVAAAHTSEAMGALVDMWPRAVNEKNVHPLISLAAFNLDFLCIHPFRDGNGRVSRLLMLLQAYHLDYQVGRYISFERIIEHNKEGYYESLEQSSRGWHEARHDPWAYIRFVLYVFRQAYRDLEDRLSHQGATSASVTTEQATDQATDQATEQATDQVQRLLHVLAQGAKSRRELLQALGLKHRPTLMSAYLRPALDAGLVEMTRPDKPSSPAQRYRLKGDAK